MSEIEIKPGLAIPEYEVWFTAARSGGPGGQHVNNTASKVILHWAPENSGALSDDQKRMIGRRLANRITNEGVLQLHVAEHRSQHRNKQEAYGRLAEVIRNALKRRKRRKKTRRTRGSIERRLKAKRENAEKKKMRQKIEPPK